MPCISHSILRMNNVGPNFYLFIVNIWVFILVYHIDVGVVNDTNFVKVPKSVGTFISVFPTGIIEFQLYTVHISLWRNQSSVYAKIAYTQSHNKDTLTNTRAHTHTRIHTQLRWGETKNTIRNNNSNNSNNHNNNINKGQQIKQKHTHTRSHFQAQKNRKTIFCWLYSICV